MVQQSGFIVKKNYKYGEVGKSGGKCRGEFGRNNSVTGVVKFGESGTEQDARQHF